MEEKKNTLIYFIGGIVLAAAIIGGIFYFISTQPKSEIDSNSDTPVSGNIIEGKGTITEEEVVIEEGVPAPDFTRPLSFGPDISVEVQAVLQGKHAELKSLLQKDSTNFSAWNALGTLRKTGGDYEGAAEIWVYLTKAFPKSTIHFDNLGDLYLNFIKDYPKAESYFKASIAYSPGNIHAYQQLFALYTDYGYKAGTSAAADILTQGLTTNPGDETLLQMQAQLESGDQ